jgi:hypothetical protein
VGRRPRARQRCRARGLRHRPAVQLIDGSWRPNGDPEVLVSPVDGAKLTELLVQAVTQGPPGELLYGNFPEHSRYPAAI